MRTNIAHCAVLELAAAPRSRWASGPGVLAGQREVHRLHEREVEEHLELVAVVAEELAQLLRRQVHLAEQHRVALATRHERP